jgi:RNA polymerase sigma-B factor
MQVGYVGLLKAMNNFDPFPGCSLVAYAQAYIIGELKCHFRDKGWQVHVERSVQELVLAVREAAQQLSQQLGRLPGDAELASYLGVSDAGIRKARRAELALRSWSLDEPLRGQDGAASLGDLLGEDDPQVEHMLGMRAVAAHWGELPGREQQILLMRFHGDMTQAQGASRFAGEAARGGQGWRPSARRYLMTIKPGEEPRIAPAGSSRRSELHRTKRNAGPVWRQYLRAVGPGVAAGAPMTNRPGRHLLPGGAPGRR